MKRQKNTCIRTVEGGNKAKFSFSVVRNQLIICKTKISKVT